MVHYRGGRAAIAEDVYPDLDAFWDDLSAAYAAEVQALYDLGCRYLQLDDTSLAYLNDPRQREMMTGKGADALHLHERYIRQINAAVGGRPDDMVVTTHSCRGNFRSSWVAEGGYDFVAEALFEQLDVNGSSSSTTTSAPAASSRCASCRRASGSSSASSRPSEARSRTRAR
jgi:5-methyltetrahydropteroyltriglutamate--homocysteine methyltransferase